MVNKKFENFPYMYINPENLENENLPDKKYFYNMLTLKILMIKNIKKLKIFIKIWNLKILKNI